MGEGTTAPTRPHPHPTAPRAPAVTARPCQGCSVPPGRFFFLGGGQCRTCSSSYFSQNLLVKGRQVRYSIQRQLMG